MGADERGRREDRLHVLSGALRAFAEHVLPWLWATFAITVATGLALFLYDPVHVGAHAYWSPKLISIGLGLFNAAFFHRG